MGSHCQTLTVRRFAETDKSTTSVFTLGALRGYMLEPPGPSTTQSGLNQRIPAGYYRALWWDSPHFKQIVPNLHNYHVPSSRRILIHNGNSPQHTQGCLLIGSTYTKDFVGHSKASLSAFLKKIHEIGIDRLHIVIKDI